MEVVVNIVTILAFVFTALTFFVLYFRARKSEQFNIANDISKSFTDIEDKILSEGDSKKMEYRHKQYLNVWEWFSLLVNNGELKNETILDHFRPMLIRDHNVILKKYPKLNDDNNEFPQFKELYRKWIDP